jgi:hypothetical protein
MAPIANALDALINKAAVMIIAVSFFICPSPVSYRAGKLRPTKPAYK